MLAFRPPSYAIAEVTGDRRFAGGRLVRTPQGTHDLAEPPVALKRRASGGS